MSRDGGEILADRSVEYWDTAYETHQGNEISDDDAVGAAALKHFGGLDGKRLLDLGCGLGEYSLFFARHGATVVAVDNSATATERLRRRCKDIGAGTVAPVTHDAFAIDELGTFDCVFGSMILHHLEPFGSFVDVLRKTLVPTGRGFFYENSAQSRALIWARDHVAGRFGIPKFGDPDEFPLEPREIELLRREFRVDIEVPDLFLVQLACIYLLRSRGYSEAMKADTFLYRFEALHKYSYRQMVLLSSR